MRIDEIILGNLIPYDEALLKINTLKTILILIGFKPHSTKEETYNKENINISLYKEGVSLCSLIPYDTDLTDKYPFNLILPYSMALDELNKLTLIHEQMKTV